MVAALTRRGRDASLLAVGAVLLALAWRLAPASTPLYDGLPISAEPYRYLQPPKGLAGTPPPTSASKQLNTSSGSPATILATGESPPQAQIVIGEGSIAVPSGAPSVTLSITAVPAPPPPAGGSVDGNDYRIVATLGGTVLPLRSGAPATVVLRGTGVSGTTEIERHDSGNRWTRLATTTAQGGIHLANTDRFGDFALILAGASAGGGSGSGGGGFPVLAVVLGAVVILAAVAPFVLVRLARRRG